MRSVEAMLAENIHFRRETITQLDARLGQLNKGATPLSPEERNHLIAERGRLSSAQTRDRGILRRNARERVIYEKRSAPRTI